LCSQQRAEWPFTIREVIPDCVVLCCVVDTEGRMAVHNPGKSSRMSAVYCMVKTGQPEGLCTPLRPSVGEEKKSKQPGT
jgi:hypothetical protein